LRTVAEYAGDGVIRCTVGDSLPEGPVTGLNRARVEDGVLVGAVEDPDGQARIQLLADAKSDAPRLVVQWHGAWPGEVGACDALAPQRIAVSGQVVDRAGRPVPGAEVGNLVDGATPAGADGRFVVACWRGAECPLAARRSRSEGWGEFVTVVPDAPVSGIELALDAPAPSQSLQSYLEERVAEDERLEQQPDPLKLALADPRLTPEARELIEQWSEDELEQRTLTRTALAEVVSVAVR
ncbi:MAG: hypothetical protein ABMB14_25980, partial [Myxococcota bacterium]